MTTPERCGCSNVPEPQSSSHPIDDLGSEHRAIEAILDALEREQYRIGGPGTPRWSWLLAVVEVLREFADRCHHGKEEDLLFPELVALGMQLEAGPVAVMKHEHVEGRALIQRLHDAVVNRDRTETIDAIKAYVYLLREHIQKEDECLFPMARALLDGPRVARLRARFDAFERDVMGTGVHCRHLERARQLCSEG